MLGSSGMSKQNDDNEGFSSWWPLARLFPDLNLLTTTLSEVGSLRKKIKEVMDSIFRPRQWQLWLHNGIYHQLRQPQWDRVLFVREK